MGVKEPKKTGSQKLKAPPETTKVLEKEHMTISLRHLKVSHCISLCENEDKLSFVDKVRILTSKSWMEIGQFPRHGLGYEKISRDSLRVAVPEHVTPDVSVLAFRFSGKKPMVGYKDGETFYVLWFDRSFDVYAH